MPELPEVETVVSGLKNHVVGKTIKNVIVRNKSLRWQIPDDLNELISNKKILSLTRRAKYLLFEFNHGYLLMHLGMSGKLYIKTENDEVKKHDHIDFILEDKSIIRYNDARRFGCCLWANDPTEHSLLKNLGPEPLTPAFDAEFAYNLSRNKKTSVKQFLMNNKYVVGVGNIYANEALFAAKIHPLTPVMNIKLDQWEKLIKEIKRVLKEAILQGGTTLKDFVNSNDAPGYFAHSLKVYGKSNKPCPECGKPLQSLMIVQRNSVFCENCQNLY